MSNQETPPGIGQPNVVEEEVNHNGNQLVHRTVVTLGPSFRNVRRKLGARASVDDRVARQLAGAPSVSGPIPRARVSLRLVAVSEGREDNDASSGR
jgi:hypothetical protein